MGPSLTHPHNKPSLLHWGSAPQPFSTPLWGIRQGWAFSLTQSGWNQRSWKTNVTKCAKADSFLKVLFHSGEVLLRASRTPLPFPLLNRQVREPQGSSHVSHAPLHCPFVTLCAPSHLPQGRQTQAVVTVSCWCCLSSPLNSHFGNAFVQILSFKTVIKTTTTTKHFKEHSKMQQFLHAAAPHNKAGLPTAVTGNVLHLLQL